MHRRMLSSLIGLSLCVSASVAAAQRVAPAGVHLTTATRASLVTMARGSTAQDVRPTRSWLKWGLVGAAAGAVAFPLLGGMASDSQHEPARDAVVGAAAGFVIVGGGVALWQAICGPDSGSRRAGLCGR